MLARTGDADLIAVARSPCGEDAARRPGWSNEIRAPNASTRTTAGARKSS